MTDGRWSDGRQGKPLSAILSVLISTMIEMLLAVVYPTLRLDYPSYGHLLLPMLSFFCVPKLGQKLISSRLRKHDINSKFTYWGKI
jgi:hypothetical protein